jgi:hypothetical protein
MRRNDTCRIIWNNEKQIDRRQHSSLLDLLQLPDCQTNYGFCIFVRFRLHEHATHLAHMSARKLAFNYTNLSSKYWNFFETFYLTRTTLTYQWFAVADVASSLLQSHIHSPHLLKLYKSTLTSPSNCEVYSKHFTTFNPFSFESFRREVCSLSYSRFSYAWFPANLCVGFVTGCVVEVGKKVWNIIIINSMHISIT